MYNKMHTMHNGKEIRISKMSNELIVAVAANRLTYYHNTKAPSYLIALFDYVQEIEWRKKNANFDDDESWNGMSTKQIIEEAAKRNIKLNIMNTDIPTVSKTSKEIAEENWQKVEARMLPEGDHDKITAEKYCFVDNITRRLIIGNINLDLPTIFDTKRNRDCKKVRITIEVLED